MSDLATVVHAAIKDTFATFTSDDIRSLIMSPYEELRQAATHD